MTWSKSWDMKSCPSCSRASGGWLQQSSLAIWCRQWCWYLGACSIAFWKLFSAWPESVLLSLAGSVLLSPVFLDASGLSSGLLVGGAPRRPRHCAVCPPSHFRVVNLLALVAEAWTRTTPSRRLTYIQCSVGAWKSLRSPSPRPQPQHWIKFLGPWMQDFYPVLGLGLAPVWGERNSSQHPYWIKTDFPPRWSWIPCSCPWEGRDAQWPNPTACRRPNPSSRARAYLGVRSRLTGWWETSPWLLTDGPPGPQCRSARSRYSWIASSMQRWHSGVVGRLGAWHAQLP